MAGMIVADLLFLAYTITMLNSSYDVSLHTIHHLLSHTGLRCTLSSRDTPTLPRAPRVHFVY